MQIEFSVISVEGETKISLGCTTKTVVPFDGIRNQRRIKSISTIDVRRYTKADGIDDGGGEMDSSHYFKFI